MIKLLSSSSSNPTPRQNFGSGCWLLPKQRSTNSHRPRTDPIVSRDSACDQDGRKAARKAAAGCWRRCDADHAFASLHSAGVFCLKFHAESQRSYMQNPFGVATGLQQHMYIRAHRLVHSVGRTACCASASMRMEATCTADLRSKVCCSPVLVSRVPPRACQDSNLLWSRLRPSC